MRCTNNVATPPQQQRCNTAATLCSNSVATLPPQHAATTTLQQHCHCCSNLPRHNAIAAATYRGTSSAAVRCNSSAATRSTSSVVGSTTPQQQRRCELQRHRYYSIASVIAIATELRGNIICSIF